VAGGKDKPVEGAAATVAEERGPAGHVEVEREKLQWEREKFVGTCEASRFDSISNRTSDSGIDS